MSDPLKPSSAPERKQPSQSAVVREHVHLPSETRDLYNQLYDAILERWPPLVRSVWSVAELGRIAAEQRRRQSLSQHQIAEAASVGRRFVSDFENGKASVEMGKALRVLAVLGVSMGLNLSQPKTTLS